MGQPLKKIRSGAISATIWENHQEKDGKQFSFQSVTLERNYKDKDDNWQSTNNLRSLDLPKAILVLQKAYEFIALNEVGE